MKNFKRKEQKQMGNKGFSLVELIVVIAIMAVLVAVLAPQFTKYVDRSRQSNDATTVSGVVNAVQTGVADVTSYTITGSADVTYVVKLGSAGLSVTKDGNAIAKAASTPGNIVNAIEDACGDLTKLTPTANAWTEITITIVVKTDGTTTVTYASDKGDFDKYIGK